MRVDICKDALDMNTTVYLRGFVVDNNDGTYSIKNDDNTYAGQTPNQYGVFTRETTVSVKTKFALDGVIATYWPEPSSKPCSYVLRHLPNW